MINLIGNPTELRRQVTGLYSFDRAFLNADGDIGLPVGTGIELFGGTFIGKSTTAYGLAGIIASANKKDISLADFEGFDPKFLISVLTNVKFDGNVNILRAKEDEEILDDLVVSLKDKKYGVGILDSVAAISPIAEAEGSLGDANMGRRALLMAQFTRKMLKVFRDFSDKTLLMVNHEYPIMGGRGKETPGGMVKKYLATVRIQLKRKYVKGKYEEFPDGSYIIEGTVVKNRWGYKNRTFNLFVLSGKGVHRGLTAMYDCIATGLATKDRAIKMGDTSFGTVKTLVEKAQEGDEAFFDPFVNALDGISQTNNNEEGVTLDGDTTDLERDDEDISDLESDLV